MRFFWLVAALAAAQPAALMAQGGASGGAVTDIALTLDGARALDGLERQTVAWTDHGAARLLVADRCDGAALDEADGPLRLVAAGEARGARSVRQLVKLTMRAALD